MFFLTCIKTLGIALHTSSFDYNPISGDNLMPLQSLLLAWSDFKLSASLMT